MNINNTNSFSRPKASDIPKHRDYDDNFIGWKYQFDAVMCLNRLPSIDDPDANWTPESQTTYFHSLTIAIGTSNLGIAMQANKDPVKLWKLVCSMNERPKAARRVEAWGNLHNFKWKEGDNMKSYWDRLNLLHQVVVIENDGAPVEQAILFGAIFGGLPQRYQDKLVYVSSGSSPEEVIKELREIVIRQDMSRTKSKDPQQRPSNRFPPPPRFNNRTSNKERKCFYCKKKGHYRRDCRIRESDVKRGIFVQSLDSPHREGLVQIRERYPIPPLTPQEVNMCYAQYPDNFIEEDAQNTPTDNALFLGNDNFDEYEGREGKEEVEEEEEDEIFGEGFVTLPRVTHSQRKPILDNGATDHIWSDISDIVGAEKCKKIFMTGNRDAPIQSNIVGSVLLKPTSDIFESIVLYPVYYTNQIGVKLLTSHSIDNSPGTQEAVEKRTTFFPTIRRP